MKFSAPLWLLVLCLAGSAGAAEPLPSCEDCNLLIVVIDTLRFDHLGHNGYARPTSPALDAFVAGARRYDAAVAQATWTIPSTASLLTASYPFNHGMSFGPGDTQAWHSLRPDRTTLAEVLQAEGFGTAALIGNPILRRKLDLDRGFDDYQLLDDPEAVATAAQQIARWDEQRFFLYLHLLGPHPGLDPPEPYATMFGPAPAPLPEDGLAYQHVRVQAGATKASYERWYRDLYDAEIRYTDKLIGDLLALLEVTGRLQDTVVVVTSDHGEHLFDHGFLGHGMSVYEALAHVPLAIRVPGDTVRVEPAVVEQVDLAPSLLEVLAVPVDDAWGWDGGALGEGDLGFCEQGPRQSVRRGRYKLIVDRSSGLETLHDLALDPAELRDYSSALPTVRDDLRAHMTAWQRRETEAVESAPLTLTDEELERLRALGYIE